METVDTTINNFGWVKKRFTYWLSQQLLNRLYHSPTIHEVMQEVCSFQPATIFSFN